MYLTSCKILGIKPGADLNTIKQAYRRQAKLYHPDINPDPKAAVEFVKVKAAFDYLVKNSDFNTGFSSADSQTEKSYRYYSPADEEYFRKWQEEYSRKRTAVKDLDFKTTLFGKSVFYFFHIVFLFTAVSITLSPILTVAKRGFLPDENVVVTLITVSFSSLFGLAMLIMILFSVLNRRVPLRFLR
ncbi:MAG: DnaJ domain-containing protein [Bacteroidales bacterium]|nr:DnaJ domain-containing protein [Bacteroidales bacterium]